MANARNDLPSESKANEADGRYTQTVEGGVVMHIGNYRFRGKMVEVFRIFSEQDWRDRQSGRKDGVQEKPLED